MAMQNSNPTILSAADLPTRQQQSRHSAAKKAESQYAGGIFAHELQPSSALLHDPFAGGYLSSPSESESDDDDLMEEPIDEQEIYDLISTISDPEHPISLGSLAVVSLPDIAINPSLPSNPTSPLRTVTVLITPTITHCSLATVIGLGVRVRLEQSLPPRFRVDVRIKEGTHSTADEVNKQLADKERVAAALENGTLMGVIGRMLETCQ
ncbi:hypothetical protein AJ79_03818 [Helicocarpus griseus UAMH5409]|uniref:MIP18 family-like domain-containing protein n=1 Tax=Helicocarpus griseus UAMH5409 TaxID=1447875 RepID=A0A2B7XWG4_9EURO|nr:hypothetical protein AJ79_03818 [Helicocarpus griseus UAMH5409]